MLTALIVAAIIWVGIKIAAEDERRMRNGHQQRLWSDGGES